MKSRVFFTVLLAVVFSLSLAVAGEKGEKSAKKPSPKKTMSCCEGKEAKGCTDEEKQACDTDGSHSSAKTEKKAEVKKENKGDKK